MKNRTRFFGEGLFETFRVYGGRKLTFVDEHLDRMAEGCRFFSIPFGRRLAVEALKRALEDIPGDREARLRLDLVTYGKDGPDKTEFETSWDLLFQPQPPMSKVRLTLAPFRRFSGSPLVRFKTTSYLENIFVLRWARKQKYFDALFANERGEITEGSITNVFFVKKDSVFTPSVEAGLLSGITRKQVIKVARQIGIPVKETAIDLTTLNRFDGAFVTNSVCELVSVEGIEDTMYEKSEIVATLHKGYKDHIKDCSFRLL